MKRRDSLKTLSLSAFGLAAVPANELVANPSDNKPKAPLKIPGGRTKEEAERDTKLMAEVFFTPHELQTITILCDIILPADDRSGSASQAGVPAFIEFMAKDQPQHQTPLRGGIMWLDNESGKRFGKKFTEISASQRINIIDDIAYPEQAKPQFSQGVAFFNKMRDLTMTGFYTTAMGFKDLGYVGNTPNNWTGVPADELAKHNLAYDPNIQYADMV